MIEFTVLGEPVSQGRPRATTINGRARMYDPDKSRDYKNYLRLVASEYAPKTPLEGPLIVRMDVYRPIPKSFSKKKMDKAEAGEIRPITKPDGSNYLKGIEDALNGLIWKDDSQIIEATIGKWYSQKPRIKIQIQEA